MNIIVKQFKKDGVVDKNEPYEILNEDNHITYVDKTNNQSIKVMSFNMKRNYFTFGPNSWKKRVHLIEEMIKNQQPDIIGTQELTEKSLMDLQIHLPQYSFVGQGRGGKMQGEFTAIFYLKDKFVLKDQETFWLSATPDKPSRGWFALCPRTCTTCTLVVRNAPEQVLRIFNTHLDHFSWISRMKSLNLISSKINEKNDQQNAKVLLMGDFNTTSTSKTLKRWYDELITKNDIHLNNSYYQLSVKDLGRSYHGFKGKVEGTPIDFIFVSHDLTIQKVELCRDNVNERYPSDHYPVFVQLAFST